MTAKLMTDDPIEISEKTGEEIFSCQPTEIEVRSDRHRQKFNRKKLDQLATSIQDTGQTQPGVCRINEEEKLELLVGERRLRACMLLQIPFKYYIKEKIQDPLLLELIQLDENTCREDLAWQEEIQAKARQHAILTEMDKKSAVGVIGGQTIAMTAEHIGVKRSILQEDVTLAGFLQVPEVGAALNKTTAKKIVKRMIEQVKRQELLSTALATTKEIKADEQIPLTEQARAEAKLKEVEKKARQFKIGPPKETKKESILDKQLIYYNKRCLLGDMEIKLNDLADESFDIVCFDPPWGVEFDKVKVVSPGTKAYEDSWDKFWSSLENWITLIYQKMKPDSHLYMFFGIVSSAFIYDTLHKVGFKTNRMPLIWWKKGAHVTRNPTIWPGRSYEPIAYARKGNKPLAKLGMPDVIETPMPTPTIKDIHPSAKHPKIYKELLLRSAQPADTILDPMAGSGMFGVAAEHLNKTHALNWVQVEVDSDYRNLQLLNLVKGYEEIARNATIKQSESQEAPFEQPALPEDFEKLVPGTEDWMRYWKEHPDKQKDMAEWSMTRPAM